MRTSKWKWGAGAGIVLAAAGIAYLRCLPAERGGPGDPTGGTGDPHAQLCAKRHPPFLRPKLSRADDNPSPKQSRQPAAAAKTAAGAAPQPLVAAADAVGGENAVDAFTGDCPDNVCVRSVVDHAVAREEVDRGRIALIGWSFGGYLAPRAASGEPRLAACIADPGQYDLGMQVRGVLAGLGTPEIVLARLPAVDAAAIAPLAERVAAISALRWSLIQRGLWVHGVASVAELVGAMFEYSLVGRAEQIRCPTLVCHAETDPISAGAQALLEALRCEKRLMRFTAAEGAAGHCEMTARTLFHHRTFDWLDDVFARPVSR